MGPGGRPQIAPHRFLEDDGGRSDRNVINQRRKTRGRDGELYHLCYDRRGTTLAHAELERHIQQICPNFARILERVWYAAHPGPISEMFAHLDKTFGLTGGFMVIEVKHAQWANLLQPDAPLRQTWGAHQ